MAGYSRNIQVDADKQGFTSIVYKGNNWSIFNPLIVNSVGRDERYERSEIAFRLALYKTVPRCTHTN